MFFPGKIASFIADENYEIDDIGMSGSSILIFENKVLKMRYDTWDSQFDETYYVKRDFCYPTIAQAKLYCCPKQSSDTGFAPALSEEETKQIRYTVFNERQTFSNSFVVRFYLCKFAGK